jgi:Domain of unknown function (DUF4105)
MILKSPANRQTIAVKFLSFFQINWLMKRTALLVIFFLSGFTLTAQLTKDSCTMEISLLTCAPGTDLYSLFGHTAIRIQDPLRGMDVIYNYGTFDDADPLFYVHFTRGIMRYSLSAETYDNFMEEYRYEKRSVKAQVLNLSCPEKNQLYDSLRKNTQEENRFYDYHFHTDNCTTRAGQIIELSTREAFYYKNILPDPGPSYRDMIHEYLDRQHQSWPEFGIDMLLGKNLDIKPTNIQAIHFLPDYLYRGMDSAYAGKKYIVFGKKTLLDFPDIKTDAGWLTPDFLFIVLFVFSIVLHIFRKRAAGATISPYFDTVFFSMLGLVGILMAAVWLGRVDNVCRNNINILWALPTHIVAVFFIRRKASWIKYYFLATAAIAVVLLIGYPWWTQRINTAVLPLLGIIIFRSYVLSQNRNHAKKTAV